MQNHISNSDCHARIEITSLKFDFYKDYIESINVYHFKDTVSSLFLPEGKFEIILQLSHTFYTKLSKGGNWLVRPPAFIGGLHTTSYMVKPESSGVDVLGIKFKPFGAKFFIQRDLRTYKNTLTTLEESFDSESIAILNELSQESSESKILTKIKSFLDKNFKPDQDSSMETALSILHAHRGFYNISSLAGQLKLSNSQFRNRFNKEVGLSPKTYSKILRINSAHQLVLENHYRKITDLAYDLGYFDQAHFIKDFKSLTKITPAKYYANHQCM